jgi:hypothetical protein
MTQQLMYDMLTCMLHATLSISSQLDEPVARQIRKNVGALQKAVAEALARGDTQQLRSLCDEVTHLGNKVKTLL